MVAFVLVPGLVGLLRTHAQHMLSYTLVFSPPLPSLSHLATASALPISCALCVRVCATNIHNKAEREARKEEAEREARKEEAAAQERKWEAELNLRKEEVRLQHELDMTRIRSERRERAIRQENDQGDQEGELEEVEERREPPRIPMPKFNHDSSQDVSHFLELFEKVAKQNGYPESSWSLAFRVAVAGKKLEHIAAYGDTHDDIKKEVLLAHGHTPEQLWCLLTNVKQGAESFRQLFWRTITKHGQFFKLAVKAESQRRPCIGDLSQVYSAFSYCFSKILFDFRKSISGPIELKLSGKTLNAILLAPIYFWGVYF